MRAEILAKILIVVTIWIVPIYSSDIPSIPESFKHLEKVTLPHYKDVFAYVVPGFQRKIEFENVFYEENPMETIIGFIKINQSDSYLVTFSPGASEDFSFSFYHNIGQEFTYKFAIPGKQIFIPGNGYIYVSGHSNNMFNIKKKYSIKENSIEEVPQPLYYVGIKTKTLKPIKLYLTKEKNKVVASLPEDAYIEVIASDFSENTQHFLIKTSFGLLGWWTLDNYNSKEIDRIFFAGD